MEILVTGGTGFIGSHTVVQLLQENHSVIIVDDFSNSNASVLDEIKSITNKDVLFYQCNVSDEKSMREIFCKHSFDGVIHFAGYKSVGESVSLPLKYYTNNLMSTITLTKLCLEFNVNKIVFSSSATVYGNNVSPLMEDMELLETSNPYGETKAMCERILKDISISNQELSVIVLRYFNPIGAHKSGRIGEKPAGISNNLMPYITNVASGLADELKVFGDDYDTIDGTGVRDFIHVMDLAQGHICAIESIIQGYEVINLGTGKGTSVLQLIHTFEKVNNITIPYKIINRREGDFATSFADVSKAKKILQWEAKHTIEDMCIDSWNFAKNNVTK